MLPDREITHLEFDRTNALKTDSASLVLFAVAVAMSDGYTNLTLTKTNGTWTMSAKEA
jgi:hypothetical protein